MRLVSRLTEALLGSSMIVLPATMVLVSTLLASTAQADVIPDDYEPPPCPHVDCPAGTMPLESLHHDMCGRGCTLPRECGTPESCDTGAACGDTRYCVRRDDDNVIGECAADGSCAEGECIVARRCLTAPPVAQPPAATSPDSSGGCAACAIAPGAEGRTGFLIGGVLLAVGCGALGRLRRRSRSKMAD